MTFARRFRSSTPHMIGALALACVSGAALRSEASIQLFSDRSDWEAAIGSLPILEEDFSGQSDGTIPQGVDTSLGLLRAFYETSGGGNSSGWRISSTDGHFGNSRHHDFRSDTGGADQTVTAEWRFDKPVIAFGADFEGIIDSAGLELSFVGTGYSVTVYDVINQDAMGSPMESGFLGVVLDDAFSKISITSSSTIQAAVDNASFVPVPEPTSLILWAGVLAAGVGATLRARRD